MGNNNQMPVANELTFQQQVEDKHFGQVQIYRTNSGLYIMKLCRTAISGDRSQQQFLRVIHLLSSQAIPSIIPIVHYQRTEQKGICSRFQRMDIYTEYYNFTLNDLFNSRKDVEEAELWLVLNSLLQLTIAIRQHQISIALELDKVFLTPAGVPCVYHCHLRSCRDSIDYSEFTMGQNVARIVLQLALNLKIQTYSEEELLGQTQLFIKLIGKYKLLGTLVRHLLVRDKIEEQVLEQIDALLEKGAIAIASEIKLLRFKYRLPENPQFLNTPTLTRNANTFSSKDNKENKLATLPIARTPLRESNHLTSTELTKKRQPESSALKEPRSSCAKSVYNESSSKKSSHLPSTKDENLRQLNDLERKKEQYRIQREKFQLRKEQLLRAGKEAPPVARNSEKRRQEPRERKASENQGGRYR